jgi:glycosyltransferase involved in cell wall biosynthesis
MGKTRLIKGEIQRVLLSINSRWWNAEAAYAINLARGLRQQGVSVWIVVNINSPAHREAVKHNIPVIDSIKLDSFSPLTHWRNYRKLQRIIEEKRIQIINSFKSNGSFLFSAIKQRKPSVVYIKTRGEARPPKRNFLNRYLYGKGACDGIITVGSEVDQWIQEVTQSGKAVPKRIVYYSCPSLSRHSETEARRWRKEMKIPRNNTVLGLIGRTQRVKGHLISLKALKLMESDSLTLLFLVKDLAEFPDELTEIKDYISENNLRDRVVILGFQKELNLPVSSIDIGLIPSLASEVNCRVAVEFFSMGIPVVAFPTGSLPDVIEHKKNGYVCREKSEQCLAKGIKWMIDHPAEYRQLAKQARLDYKNSYTLDQLAENTIEFYRFCQ